jgi:hypothetical protein
MTGGVATAESIACPAMFATAAITWVQVVLALHIIFVVIAFGVIFAYPLFLTVGARLEPSAMPWFFRMQQVVSRRLISPGLLLVVIFGVILASKYHAWSDFYVQWGIGAAIVIGAIEGSWQIPRSGRLAEVAERDVAGAGGVAGTRGGAVTGRSPEYATLLRQVQFGGTVNALLVVLTAFFMAVHLGS